MLETALQFSGGRDSLACLYLYREQWDQLYVMWANTGAAYPEAIEYMQRWKERLPHFVEVKTDQPAPIKAEGWPSDVVPLRYTTMGRLLSMDPPFLIQDWMGCCLANIFRPMHEEMKRLGVKQAIRGERNPPFPREAEGIE